MFELLIASPLAMLVVYYIARKAGAFELVTLYGAEAKLDQAISVDKKMEEAGLDSAERQAQLKQRVTFASNLQCIPFGVCSFFFSPCPKPSSLLFQHSSHTAPALREPRENSAQSNGFCGRALRAAKRWTVYRRLH